MQEYLVSIDIETSSSVTQADIESFFGTELTRTRLKRDGVTHLWCYDSPLEENLPLNDHILALASVFNPEYPILLTEDITFMYLNIGIMCDLSTAIPDLEISMQAVDLLRKKLPELEIEIIVYPDDLWDKYVRRR